MGVVTGFTSERMLVIEESSVISGLVDINGHLLLSTRGGDVIDAGDIAGPVAANFVDATTTLKGVVELATDAETVAGVDTTRVVTPNSLGAGLSKVLPSRLKASNNLGSGVNPDTLVDTGWYSGYNWGGSLTGMTIGVLEVNCYSPDWISQTFQTVAVQPRIFVRSRYNGTTWSPWIEIYTKPQIDALVYTKTQIDDTVTSLSDQIALKTSTTQLSKVDSVMAEAFLASDSAVNVSGSSSDLCPATGTMVAKTAVISCSGQLNNGNSGATRTANLQLVRDGVAIGTSQHFMLPNETGQAPGQGFSLSMPITETAGNHTYALRAGASAASAVQVRSVRLWVTQRGI